MTVREKIAQRLADTHYQRASMSDADHWDHIVDAVLDTLMEPSEEVKAAIHDAVLRTTPWGETYMVEVWQAAIRAAREG